MNITPQTHQPQIHFGQIKGIRFKDFDTKECVEYAKVVESFKENEAFNKLLKEHDGIVIFDSFFGYDKLDRSRVTVRYAKPKTNSIMNLISKIVNFGDEYERYNQLVTLSAKDFFSSWSAEKLCAQIRNTTPERLAELIKRRSK